MPESNAPGLVSSAIPQLVDVEPIARQLGIRKEMVYRLVASGEIPHVRIGTRTIRFDLAAVAAYVAAGGHK